MNYKTRLETAKVLQYQIKELQKDSERYEERSATMKEIGEEIDEKITELQNQKNNLFKL